jgi:phosphoribosylanthranilate isomerase
MSMVRVKICGITNWADAKLAVATGADALGFNFCPASPRRVALRHAREIIRHLPRRVIAVGVFVNASEKEILRIARAANLNMLQLHGEEPPKTVKRLTRHFPVIKAFRVKPKFRVRELGKYKDAAAFLLDGFDSGLRGGTGRTFDWRIAREARRSGPVILAGGLRPENVAAAIRRAKPFAIDVCSGVESGPGKKDPRKLRALMAAVGRVPHEQR